MDDALFPMADLASRWGVTSNTVSRRLAFLGIKPIRQGNFRFLDAEQMDLAEQLQQHVLSGKPMEAFPKPEGETVAIARRQTGKRDEPDPLARRLKEAADLGVWLTNAELASVLGLAESTLRDKSHDYSPRPGFSLERRQEEKGGAIWWRVKQEGGNLAALPTSGATSRTVGFGGAIEASFRAVSSYVELPVIHG
jgi:hypothetical protein